MISLATATDRSRPGLRNGTAALEFVLVLPVLIVIVVGMTDLGRAVACRNVLSNAARTGAAYAATHQVTDFTFDDWESRVIDHAVQEAANLADFDRDLLEVSVRIVTDADGSQRIHVEVSYPFELLIDWPGWPRRIVLSRGVAMRSYR